MNALRVSPVVVLAAAALGLVAVVAPAMIADFFGFDLQPATKLGLGEVGALYGGNFIGLGLVGLYAARENFDEGPMLIAALGMIWLCIAGGRMLVMLTRAAEASSMLGWLSFLLEAAVGLVYVLHSRTASRPL